MKTYEVTIKFTTEADDLHEVDLPVHPEDDGPPRVVSEDPAVSAIHRGRAHEGSGDEAREVLAIFGRVAGYARAPALPQRERELNAGVCG